MDASNMAAGNKGNYGVLTSVKKEVVAQNETVLLAEWRKCQLIVLVYRLAVITAGLVLIYLGYALFSSSVIDSGQLKHYYFSLERITPGTALAVSGIVLIIIGVAKLMPLPRFEKSVNALISAANGNAKRTAPQKNELAVEDGIPVLRNAKMVSQRDKVWQNNVKPLIVKVANHEEITPVDRDLLKKWLYNTN